MVNGMDGIIKIGIEVSIKKVKTNIQQNKEGSSYFAGSFFMASVISTAVFAYPYLVDSVHSGPVWSYGWHYG